MNLDSVGDAVVFLATLGLALYFSHQSLNHPYRSADGRKFSPGVVSTYIRVIGFPFIASGLWFIMASFANALNNYIGRYNAVYTSPTFGATTISPPSIDPGGPPLYFIFYGLFFIFILIGFVQTFYFAFRPMESDEKSEVDMR